MKLNISNIFSYNKTKTHLNFRFLGIKFSCPNYERKLLNREYKKEQDKYDLSNIKNAKKIIAFIIPSNEMVNGGIMSIFSICKYSREICPDAECLIITESGEYTYTHNYYFKNEEKIYRWEQFINNLSNVQELILHIPEYMCKESFYKHLTRKDKRILKNIPCFQINILNQNIELMPEPKKINKLKALTKNITQTIAHDRYATQEVCNKWGIPTHLLSCYLDFSVESNIYGEKEKNILYSPDTNEYKEELINSLKGKLSNFNFIEVKDLTFEDFQKIVSKSFATISFGEGFDGYFLQPCILGSLGISVYNDKFFPDRSWLELDNVFDSWNNLDNKIVELVQTLEQDFHKYIELVNQNKQKHDELYGQKSFIDKLNKFYQKRYDFMPIKEVA